jgi:hypothetical protein
VDRLYVAFVFSALVVSHLPFVTLLREFIDVGLNLGAHPKSDKVAGKLRRHHAAHGLEDLIEDRGGLCRRHKTARI